MDTPLACIDPNLLQWNQLLEDDEPAPPPQPLESSATTSSSTPQPQSLPSSTTEDAETGSEFVIFQSIDDAFPEAAAKSALEDLPAASTSSSSSSLSESVVKSLLRSGTYLLDKSALELEDEQKKDQLVGNISEAEAFIRQLGTGFRKRKVPKNFGQSDWRSVAAKKKLYWDGAVPYVKAAGDVCIYECHRGPDHDAGRKERRKLKTESKSRRLVTLKSKKNGCPARIVLEERVYFPQFKAKSEDNVKLTTSMRAVRLHVKSLFDQNPESVEGVRKIHINLDGDHNHSGCHKAKGPSEELLWVDKIHDLVWTGVDKMPEVKSALGLHNKPGKEITNHIDIAKNYMGNFFKQQEALQAYVAVKKEEDPLLYFRPMSKKSSNLTTFEGGGQLVMHLDNELLNQILCGQIDLPAVQQQEEKSSFNLLLVHQSRFQRDLLSKYGDKVIFLDTICKAIRSHLTFHMLWVKSPVDYQPVAFIVTSSDDTGQLLKEALGLIHSHCSSSWSPQYCICSSASSVISGIESSFPSISVIISDSCREHAWNEWFACNSLLGADAKVQLRTALDNLAGSKSIAAYEAQEEKVMSCLRNVDKPEVTSYWQEQWLKCASRWVYVLACAKVLDQGRIKYYLSLDKAVVTETNTHEQTRRLVNLHETVTSVLENYLPLMKSSHDEVTRAVGGVTNNDQKEHLKGHKVAMKCLDQIMLVLEECTDSEGLTVAKELIDCAVADLIPLLSDREESNELQQQQPESIIGL